VVVKTCYLSQNVFPEEMKEGICVGQLTGFSWKMAVKMEAEFTDLSQKLGLYM